MNCAVSLALHSGVSQRGLSVGKITHVCFESRMPGMSRGEMPIMTDVDETAEHQDEATLNELIATLSGRDRKARQVAAHSIALLAKEAPEAVVAYTDDIVAAVDRPEALTRWEALDALTSLVSADPEAAAKGFEGAENALYDEESGLVRFNAFRYLTVLGSSSQEWSVKTWPLIDEAIQCYHGDPEFNDMLDVLTDFARSDLDNGVRKALADRLRFDANNTRGPLAVRARHIIEILE